MEGIPLSIVSLVEPLRTWRRLGWKSSDSVERNKYHCVSIKPRRGACKAVLELEGKRFLSDEAPMFPLEKCDASRCKCRYVHYDDRRQENRRGTDAGYPEWEYDGQNRRGKRGRRWTDKIAKPKRR